MVNKKSAPQKNIVSINRIGGWGDVSYHHTLECGHIEVRKRASEAPKIACTWCVVGEEKGKELKALTLVQPPTLEELWDFYDPSSNEEVDEARTRADLATILSCPQENIEVVSTVGDNNILELNYVTVFLDAELVKRIIAKNLKRGG